MGGGGGGGGVGGGGGGGGARVSARTEHTCRQRQHAVSVCATRLGASWSLSGMGGGTERAGCWKKCGGGGGGGARRPAGMKPWRKMSDAFIVAECRAVGSGDGGGWRRGVLASTCTLQGALLGCGQQRSRRVVGLSSQPGPQLTVRKGRHTAGGLWSVVCGGTGGRAQQQARVGRASAGSANEGERWAGVGSSRRLALSTAAGVRRGRLAALSPRCRRRVCGSCRLQESRQRAEPERSKTAKPARRRQGERAAAMAPGQRLFHNTLNRRTAMGRSCVVEKRVCIRRLLSRRSAVVAAHYDRRLFQGAARFAVVCAAREAALLLSWAMAISARSCWTRHATPASFQCPFRP